MNADTFICFLASIVYCPVFLQVRFSVFFFSNWKAQILQNCFIFPLLQLNYLNWHLSESISSTKESSVVVLCFLFERCARYTVGFIMKSRQLQLCFSSVEQSLSACLFFLYRLFLFVFGFLFGATRNIALANLQCLNFCVVEFLSMPVESLNMLIPYWVTSTNQVIFQIADLKNSKYSCHVAFYVILPCNTFRHLTGKHDGCHDEELETVRNACWV